MADLPVMDLSVLSAADIRTVIKMERATGLDRADLLLDLLDKVTVGGLAAIPLPHMRAYQDRLASDLKDILDPKP